MPTSRKVNHRIKTGYEVRTEIVVTWSGKLYIDGQRQIAALYILGCVSTTYLLMEDKVLLSEVYGGRETQGKVSVETQLTQHTNRETGVIVVDVCIPLFTLRGYIPIVTKFQILNMKTQEEPIMQLTIIQVWPIHNLTRLGHDSAKAA
jgi:hypothetical protein